MVDNVNICDKLHQLFNKMKKYNSINFDQVPFDNGIYIFIDSNEKYKGMDRIVRVGTHATTSKSKALLKDRLHSHFKGNRKCSIFRKNIGRAIILKDGIGDLMLKFWNSKKSKHFKTLQNYNELDECKKYLEKQISKYINDLWFIAIPFKTWQERDRFETGIISTLCQCEDFKASKEWLGNFVPKGPKTKIAENRLWCSDKANGPTLSDEEYKILRDKCKEYFIC